MSRYRKMIGMLAVITLAVCLCGGTAFAAGSTGDVAGAIESTWNDASDQIKTVVNNVVFPVIDLILAVFFFAKLGMAYFDYRKHGQFEWTAPAILFACLLFTLTAPRMYGVFSECRRRKGESDELSYAGTAAHYCVTSKYRDQATYAGRAATFIWIRIFAQNWSLLLPISPTTTMPSTTRLY